MNKHHDERHLAYFDIFPLTQGQINISKIYPRTVVGWHKHEKQVDHWFVLNGVLKVGTFDEVLKFQLLREGEEIIIPAGVWHGYMSLTDVDLVYYCSNKYDGSDEFRQSIGSFGDNWEVEAK